MLDRALGALYGLAIGDALGMPTQSMRSTDIRADYGAIDGFRDAGPRQVIAAGMKAGTVTDDTAQAVLLGELLVAGGGQLDAMRFAHALLAWEKSMAARGLLDLLGPSTKRAVERIQQGVPASEAGRYGSTNGAAMRIAPVGVARRPEPVSDFLAAVVQACEVTHNTSLGIAAAAAVGMAVSVGVEGGTLDDAVAAAVRAADLADGYGHPVAGGRIAARIPWAVDLVRTTPEDRRGRVLEEVVGTSVASQESVVAAFALVAVVREPWQAMCLTASLGGDTDTIAAIVGAVLGAVVGVGGLPVDAVAQVRAVNNLDLEPLARSLLAIRAT